MVKTPDISIIQCSGDGVISQVEMWRDMLGSCRGAPVWKHWERTGKAVSVLGDWRPIKASEDKK